MEFEYQKICDVDGGYLVKDTFTKTILMVKERSVYDIAVYKQLMNASHPHLVRIDNIQETNGILSVYEEYIVGDTLQSLLVYDRLTFDEKVRIYDDVLSAVEYLHSLQPVIIHRDIKTANIMVDNRKSGILIDCNAAKIKTASDKDTVLLGTYGKAAPEQYGFMASDERTDVYGCGILLKEMFKNDDRFKSIVEKATKMDPSDRYPNIQMLRKSFASTLQRNILKKTSHKISKGQLFMYFVMVVFPFVVTNVHDEKYAKKLFMHTIGIAFLFDFVFNALGIMTRVEDRVSGNGILKLIIRLSIGFFSFFVWLVIYALVC